MFREPPAADQHRIIVPGSVCARRPAEYIVSVLVFPANDTTVSRFSCMQRMERDNHFLEACRFVLSARRGPFKVLQSEPGDSPGLSSAAVWKEPMAFVSTRNVGCSFWFSLSLFFHLRMHV